MAGVNIAGELKEPAKQIPRGTLTACAFTFAVISAMAVFSALTVNPTMMQQECLYFNNFSLWSPIIPFAVFVTAFAPALSNTMGASRILEAVTKDLMIGPMAKVHETEKPALWVCLTWILVELFLLMGSMNKIAKLCSVLYMISYGSTSVACFFLKIASAPNFRPNFKFFSWQTSLIDIIGSIVSPNPTVGY